MNEEPQKSLNNISINSIEILILSAIEQRISHTESMQNLKIPIVSRIAEKILTTGDSAESLELFKEFNKTTDPSNQIKELKALANEIIALRKKIKNQNNET